jgi:hypothetical protein
MPALALNPRTGRFVDLRLDEASRRIIVTIVGACTGAQVSSKVAQMFTARPELTAWDMLYDILDYTGDVEAEHIKPIAEAYERSRPDPSVRCRTAFATHDPNFGLWATSMDFHFPGREHRAFATLEDAVTFLDSPR